MTPTVANLRLYPIKSLDPVEVTQVTIGVRSLLHDRAFALLAGDGRLINGKRTGRVNELKATYELDQQLIHLVPRAGGTQETFHLHEDKAGLEAYISDFFGMPVQLLHNEQGRLLDIPDESSVTVVSESSLEALREAFPELSLEELRLRFRSNIEINGVPAYWEEHLVVEPGVGVRFRIGEVTLIGISPRARCNVPPRDPFTGQTDKQFVKKMTGLRQQTLPTWSHIGQFGGYYQLTINTFIPDSERGKKIQLGDPVAILDRIRLDQ
jgi:uncharacterized protein YcbX